MSPQPRVVYIITKLELGGAQKVCLTLFHDLTQQNISTSLISGTEGPLVPHVTQRPGAILLKEFQREVGFNLILSEWKTFWKVVKILRQMRQETPNLIVHTHSTKAGLVGRWAAFFAGVKHRIHTIHGFGFHDRQSWPVWIAIYLLELITSLITTHFVCVSEQDQQTGLKLFPYFAKKNSLIRAAVDEKNCIRPAQQLATWRDDQVKVIGTISCFKPQKNLIDLLHAFDKVVNMLPAARRASVRLEIIGDGAQRPLLEQWIAEHNLQDQIILHGWQDNVASFLHTWDIFAMSSLWEGLPCAVIEARLAGLPVVAYDVGGIKEVIHDGVNGYLVEPANWRKLAEHLFDLVTTQDTIARMATHNDDLHPFYRQTMVDGHATLYKRLVQR